MRPIFLSDGDKFQPHAARSLNVTDDSLGSDLPLFYKKIDLCRSPDAWWLACLKKHSAKAQIPDTQNIIASGGVPIHPNFWGFYTRGLPAGVRRRWHKNC